MVEPLSELLGRAANTSQSVASGAASEGTALPGSRYHPYRLLPVGPGIANELAEGGEIVISHGQIERAVFGGRAENGECQDEGCE